MTLVGSAKKRGRRIAYAKAIGIAVAIVTTAAWMVAACITGTFEVCDPKNWQGGAQSAQFFDTCCKPSIYDGGPVDWPYCPNYDGPDAAHHGDAMNASDGGDASADGPIEPPCSGECVAFAASNWTGPFLLWLGPEPAAPPCPATAPMVVFEGHGDLDAGPLPCAPCACERPNGDCGLPSALTANAAICGMMKATTPHTPFDPPTGWDGGCAADVSIAAGKLCNGAPCVESVTIAPLVVNETGCAVAQPPLPVDPPTWGTFARACQGSTSGTCADLLLCAAAPAPGFRRCVAQAGVVDCSASGPTPYTEPHVFDHGVEDMRSCSPCSCGQPAGSTCTAEIAIFGNGACTGDAGYVVTVGSDASACVDTLAGAPLGSKSATPSVYAAGACPPSGGLPVGDASPTAPTTFCCIPM